MKITKLLASAAITLTACIAPLVTHAADAYPARPVRLLVGFSPGGLTDQLARLYGQKLGEALGKPVVVDNRPGAGGNIAVQMITQSQADGYTLVMAANYVAINAALDRNTYDWDKDLKPVALIASTPNIVVVPANSPLRSVADLIAAGKTPGKLTYGSAGVGSTTHMAVELFNAMSGTAMTHVPYKGVSPAELDLVAGTVSLMFDSITTAAPMVKSGKLKAIAVTGPKRTPAFPELPTVHEAGLKGFDVEATYMVLAPAGTPQHIVDQLSAAVAAISRDPATRKVIEGLYATPLSGGPGETKTYLRKEVAKWQDVVRKIGVKAD
ncbi:Bug family tripartite tricarboxylate transporter substrate binding protein [Cupriavidus oxalaticus]|uniref:Tripartite tricarboxylate transporter substrate binding protein n=1 Tax=Cupriavidus oxalaticus TaxID=96344 RepID=A0A5P3VSD9_9BURK|nr:tripartite tricarboxylate transporter substrate binding protein [Cupriavidus oxalaticus]QEZ48928.1 tripartite tricarboxylate transporter substrate binding protein [Cupriavidus oxalaticus]